MKCILDLFVTLLFGVLLFTAALMQIIYGRLHESCLVWLTKAVVGSMATRYGQARKISNSQIFVIYP
jgi:hypothetical protein